MNVSRQKTPKRLGLKGIGLILVICLLILSMRWFLISKSEEGIHIYFLDVGQGDAFVVADEEDVFLIDGGGDRFLSDDRNMGLVVIHPFLLEKKIKDIDLIFVSHVHYDHMKGILEIINLMKVKQLVLPKPYEAKVIELEMELDIEVNNENPNNQNPNNHNPNNQNPNNQNTNIQNYENKSQTFGNTYENIFGGGDEMALLKELVLVCKDNSVSIQYMEEGDTLKTKNLTFSCLYPYVNAKYNNHENLNSLVLQLDVHELNILFTGDVEKDGEVYLTNHGSKLEDIDILKVPHHGSNSSSSEEFLEVLRPQVAIVSYGKNMFGHPSDIVKLRYRNLNIPMYSTKKYGMIEVIITEEEYKIVPFKGELIDETTQGTIKE